MAVKLSGFVKFLNLFLIYIIVIFDPNEISAHLVSPCPRLFSYEVQKEADRWYGTVTLVSESDLQGVWLRLIFDRPSLQLGNWFGEIKTTDNKEYLIKNRNHMLKANMPYALRFYLKYDQQAPAPQLVAFRLNAKTICPEGESTTPVAITGGQLITSNGDEVTTPIPPQPVPEAGPSFGPVGGWSPPAYGASDDDDVFVGDFQLINKPHLNPALDSVECGTVVTERERTKRQTAQGNQKSTFEVYHLSENGAAQKIKPDQNFNQLISSVINGQYPGIQYASSIMYSYPTNGHHTAQYHQQSAQNLAQYNGDRTNHQETQNNSYLINRRGEEIAPTEAQPRPLITYGQSTKEGEFPWHAALYHEKGADLQYICGASLISRNHVITVAHCVTRRRSQTTLNPDSLVVYLGKYYLKKWSNPGIQDSQVMKIVVHPEYNSQSYANDLAILKLLNPVVYSDYVRPICLWSKKDANLNAVLNKAGTVVGWGFDHTGKVTEELTQAKMPVVTKETCIYSFPDFFSRFTTSRTYCAGFRNGTSVCNGDSGGGMVFPQPTSSPNRQAWHLRGLVSISVALQNKFRCDSSHYIVFTDIAQYLDWIQTVMAH